MSLFNKPGPKLSKIESVESQKVDFNANRIKPKVIEEIEDKVADFSAILNQQEQEYNSKIDKNSAIIERNTGFIQEMKEDN